MQEVADTAPLLHDTATAIINCFNCCWDDVSLRPTCRYLERVKELVDTARLETGADQVDLLCHSGGWVGEQQGLLPFVSWPATCCGWDRLVALASCAAGWLGQVFLSVQLLPGPTRASRLNFRPCPCSRRLAGAGLSGPRPVQGWC